MKLAIGVLFFVVLEVLAAPTEPLLVQDEAGNMHLINPDPYSVVDVELEPLFNPENDIVFQLFTRRNPVHPQILQWNNPATVQNSNFDPANPTRFTIHGWSADGTSVLHSSIREHYFRVGDFNVITVDWGAGSLTLNYATARNRVASVGEVVSRMIDTLVDTSGISRNSVDVIGHSIGAHAAAVTGKQQLGRLNAVIGLSPAGPLFSLDDPDILQPTDAQYVEAVFTAAGTTQFDLPLGVANFFANGGRSQPGCGIDISRSCAHARSHELFAESLSSSTPFLAMKCESHNEVLEGRCTSSGPYAAMGGEPSNNGRGVQGIFWFNTNSESPFARG